MTQRSPSARARKRQAELKNEGWTTDRVERLIKQKLAFTKTLPNEIKCWLAAELLRSAGKVPSRLIEIEELRSDLEDCLPLNFPTEVLVMSWFKAIGSHTSAHSEGYYEELLTLMREDITEMLALLRFEGDPQ